MAWVRGPKVDYSDWAELVGDDWWKWDNILERMKKLESFRPKIGQQNYATATPGAHGTGGPFAVGYGTEWQPLIKHCMLAGEEAGHEINKDNNDGDLEGISIAQFNVDKGCRVTSATAYLEQDSRPDNLLIATDALISRLVIEKKRVTGVEILLTTANGSDQTRKLFARREVILAAGCFQSPQLLLLSGVGPKKDLEALNIPIVMDLPVGQNLQDHSALACEFIIDPSIPGHNQLLNDSEALKAAENQYQRSKTWPLAMFGASAAIIFPKIPKLHSTPEFASLAPATRDFLEAKGRPSTEIWMHSGPLFYTGPRPPDASVLVIEGLC